MNDSTTVAIEIILSKKTKQYHKRDDTSAAPLQ
jgi:hypothetical protein